MSCNNLRGEMAKRKISIEEVAKFLDIHRNSITNKLNGDCNFSVDESMKLQEKFFPDLDLKYLFKKD